MSRREKRSSAWNKPGYPSVGTTAAAIATKTEGTDVSLDIEVANPGDLVLARRQLASQTEVHRTTVKGTLDLRTAKLILPQWVADQLKLENGPTITVKYPSGAIVQRFEADVDVKVCGRHGIFMAVVEPNLLTALIGYTLLAELDLKVDFENLRVVPRDPRGPVFEI